MSLTCQNCQLRVRTSRFLLLQLIKFTENGDRGFLVLINWIIYIEWRVIVTYITDALTRLDHSRFILTWFDFNDWNERQNPAASFRRRGSVCFGKIHLLLLKIFWKLKQPSLKILILCPKPAKFYKSQVLRADIDFLLNLEKVWLKVFGDLINWSLQSTIWSIEKTVAEEAEHLQKVTVTKKPLTTTTKKPHPTTKRPRGVRELEASEVRLFSFVYSIFLAIQ